MRSKFIPSKLSGDYNYRAENLFSILKNDGIDAVKPYHVIEIYPKRWYFKQDSVSQFNDDFWSNHEWYL